MKEPYQQEATQSIGVMHRVSDDINTVMTPPLSLQ